MSKSSDTVTLEWDQQLPLLLFAYRSSEQESTKESPFFLLYGHTWSLITDLKTSVLNNVNPAYLVDMEDYKSEFLVSLSKAHKIALENIRKAQTKQKEFYDRHAGDHKFKVGERVMVYMPGDVTGKDWKLARPYHGPFRITTLTPTNAEVELIEKPSDPPLFVSISRLRRCYPEMSDTSWTGRKKGRRTKRHPSHQVKRGEQELTTPQKEGPVTRSMTKANADVWLKILYVWFLMYDVLLYCRVQTHFEEY